ncbi:MAG: Rrf2 family transcriptional regulator [Pseudomonadota bacterium]
MKISTRARYALRFMIDLASHSPSESPVVLGDIAKRQHISKRYLEQLATNLKNAKLVMASTGRGGGYTLRRAPQDIRVGEIIRATIGEINLLECVANASLCFRSEQCPSRKMWVRLTEQINEIVDSFTLAEVCEETTTVLVSRTTCGVDVPLCSKTTSNQHRLVMGKTAPQ